MLYELKYVTSCRNNSKRVNFLSAEQSIYKIRSFFSSVPMYPRHVVRYYIINSPSFLTLSWQFLADFSSIFQYPSIYNSVIVSLNGWNAICGVLLHMYNILPNITNIYNSTLNIISSEKNFHNMLHLSHSFFICVLMLHRYILWESSRDFLFN